MTIINAGISYREVRCPCVVKSATCTGMSRVPNQVFGDCLLEKFFNCSSPRLFLSAYDAISFHVPTAGVIFLPHNSTRADSDVVMQNWSRRTWAGFLQRFVIVCSEISAAMKTSLKYLSLLSRDAIKSNIKLRFFWQVNWASAEKKKKWKTIVDMECKAVNELLPDSAKRYNLRIYLATSPWMLFH